MEGRWLEYDPTVREYAVGSVFVRRGHEARTMRIVSRFPNNNYFVDRDIAALPISITKMEHSSLYLDHVTTQTR